jgi:archaeoflavoprotein AfpA
MATEKTESKKRKVAWGITGAGDKIAQFIEVMKEIMKEYENAVEIQVYLSKAAETVLKFYKLEDTLKQNFAKVSVELNSNAPFLAAWMQMRKYEFLLIAPATSNTVAKIANGIGDTLLTNAAIMSLKAFVPVYIAPTDYKEGIVYTKLPNGKEMKLRVRKEEVDQVKKLQRMEDVFVLENPKEIRDLFKKWFGQAEP